MKLLTGYVSFCCGVSIYLCVFISFNTVDYKIALTFYRACSGITLAMHHTLCGLYSCALNSLRKGDEHVTYTSLRAWHPYMFIVISGSGKVLQTMGPGAVVE